MNQIDLGAEALWTLLPVSAIATLASLAVFRRLSDPAPLRRTANRIVAHLYELRLFFDEPALVFRAQRDLFRENLRLLRIIALPSAILALPFALLFVALNAFYGHAPLVVGEPAIVTVHLSPRESMAEARLIAPAGIEIETPAVHALAANEVSWRIRPTRALSGELKVLLHGLTFVKPIVAGAGVRYLPNLSAARIVIGYPTARIYGFPWLTWFVLGAAVTALVYQFYT